LGRAWTETTHRRAAGVIVAATTVTAGAAIWFVYLQVAMVENLCPFCIATHACGILIAATVLWNARITGPRAAWMAPIFAGSAVVGILVAGQLLVRPRTYQTDVAQSAPEAACPPDRAVVSNLEVSRDAAGIPSKQVPSGRAEGFSNQASYVGNGFPTAKASPSEVQASYTAPVASPPVASFHLPGAWFDLIPTKVPCVGSLTAPHFILMISDYACPHCRVSHNVVSQTLRRYDGKISLLVLPMPLDRKCNPRLLETEGTPEPQDCALNRLALAVWCADPGSYAQMDGWLFAADRSRLEDEARSYAALLVGAGQLEKADNDRRIDAVLRLDAQLYARAKGGALPKLLLGSTMISGLLEDSQPLEDAIEKEWQLRPAGP
jgi:protein-disulfide isomerase